MRPDVSMLSLEGTLARKGTEMTVEKRRELRRFEGLSVNLALADGSRLDDVSLVSARGRSLWIFAGGEDRFVPVTAVIDAWPSTAAAA
jgi:hypothetical protein